MKNIVRLSDGKKKYMDLNKIDSYRTHINNYRIYTKDNEDYVKIEDYNKFIRKPEKVNEILFYQEKGDEIEDIREKMGYSSIKGLKQYMKSKSYIMIDEKFVKQDLESIDNLKKRLVKINEHDTVDRRITVYKEQYKIFTDFCKLKNKSRYEALREAIEQYILYEK